MLQKATAVQCSMPKDTTVRKTPVLSGDKLVVVVCDLLSNVVIAVFGSTPPGRHLILSGGEQNLN